MSLGNSTLVAPARLPASSSAADENKPKRSPSVPSAMKAELDLAELSSSNADIGRVNRRAFGRRKGGSLSGTPPPSVMSTAAQWPRPLSGGEVWVGNRFRRMCVMLAALTVAVEAAAAAAGSTASASSQSCSGVRRSHGVPGCLALVVRAAGCITVAAAGAATGLLLFNSAQSDVSPVGQRRVMGLTPGRAVALLAVGALLRFTGEIMVLWDVWSLPVLPRLSGPYCNMQRVAPRQGGEQQFNSLSFSCLWQHGFNFFRTKELGAAGASALGTGALGGAILSRGESTRLRHCTIALLTATAFGGFFEGFLLPSETLSRMGAAPNSVPVRPFVEQLEWKLRVASSGALAEVVAVAALGCILWWAAPEKAPRVQMGVAVMAAVGGVCRGVGEAAQLIPLGQWTTHSAVPIPTVGEVVCRVGYILCLALLSVGLSVSIQRLSFGNLPRLEVNSPIAAGEIRISMDKLLQRLSSAPDGDGAT
eukprot:Hpha_TRINITY_DN60_c0_g1::TRINITY_DN60_c0_g1_i1::g.110206::m.110206